jgi:tRNA(fMet)-specific endonuclease VapC
VSWLLDTNTCSYAIRGLHGVREAIEARALDRQYVSTITVAEAWTGCLRSSESDRLASLWTAFLEPFAGRILPFGEAAAKEYGAIRADLEQRGVMIGDRDCMIAAIALARRLTLVTRNVRELRRVRGLKVADWTKP